jgi:hypothetical protein
MFSSIHFHILVNLKEEANLMIITMVMIIMATIMDQKELEAILMIQHRWLSMGLLLQESFPSS